MRDSFDSLIRLLEETTPRTLGVSHNQNVRSNLKAVFHLDCVDRKLIVLILECHEADVVGIRNLVNVVHGSEHVPLADVCERNHLQVLLNLSSGLGINI